MNILVLNGSPKGEKSNTFKITAAFLKGLNINRKNDIELVEISKANVNHCLGCYACWEKTPGQCVINDDMAGLMRKYIDADLVIWSFPLYYFGMPSKIKALLDRLLPTNLPSMSLDDDGSGGHPPRYNLSHQRHVLISTCGFYSIEDNYDALFRQFEIMFDDKLTKIICPEGELLSVPELSVRIDGYLSHVRKAGEEYLLQGSFSPDTQDRISELLYPPGVFIELANASWEIEEVNSAYASGGIRAKDKSYPFLRQMAALYNSGMYKKDIILEMHFTDIDKTYQLLLGKENCTVKTDHFSPYTTRIETPFETWLEISEGKISGSEAMMKRLYKVSGDFDTMLKLDDYFGAENPVEITRDSQKSPNMLLLLLPFLAMWILMPFDYILGGAAGILASGIVTILHFWWKPTPYERIGTFATTLIGLFTIVTGGAAWQVSLPSFASGILWLTSAFLKIPLTAYYSCKDYGGESAYGNPIFMRTNRILTVVWGIAYLLWGIVELFVAGTPGSLIFDISIWAFTAVLGMFTAWFSKWYPTKIARGCI